MTAAKKLLKTSALGIPDRSKVHELPVVEKHTEWEYGVHSHDAERRGEHLDLRLGDPDTGHAHSWAIVGEIPKPGEAGWAIQQPTHTVDYMDFKGVIPAGQYGAGRVRLADRGKTEIVNARPDHISFNVYKGSGPEEYTLHKIYENRWKFYNRTLNRQTAALPDAKPKYKEIKPDQVDFNDNSQLLSSKIDGAHNLFVFPRTGQNLRVMSYRPSARETGIIEHTHKVPGIRDGIKTPSELRNTIVRGELYARDPQTDQAVKAKDLSGILNSNVWRSREKQKSLGDLRAVIFDVVQHKGKSLEEAPYDEKLKVLESIVQKHPGVFELPRIAASAKEKQKLFNQIQAGEIPETTEGVVLWDREGNKSPIKAKFRPEHDVHIRGFFPGGGKYEGKGVGGFNYSHTPRGEIVGRVGTGLTDAQREHMYRNPGLYQGLIAKVRALDVYKNKKGKPGALRAPSFSGMHLDKNPQERLDTVKLAVTLDQLRRASAALKAKVPVIKRPLIERTPLGETIPLPFAVSSDNKIHAAGSTVKLARSKLIELLKRPGYLHRARGTVTGKPAEVTRRRFLQDMGTSAVAEAGPALASSTAGLAGGMTKALGAGGLLNKTAPSSRRQFFSRGGAAGVAAVKSVADPVAKLRALSKAPAAFGQAPINSLMRLENLGFNAAGRARHVPLGLEIAKSKTPIQAAAQVVNRYPLQTINSLAGGMGVMDRVNRIVGGVKMGEYTPGDLGMPAGLAAGGALVLAANPMTRTHFKTILKGIGKGGARAFEGKEQLPQSALEVGKQLKQHILASKLDPKAMRIAVVGTGGTGKSTITKALADEMKEFKIGRRDLDIGTGNISLQGRNLSKHFAINDMPRGTIYDQTHLLNRVDPDKFDMLIRLYRNPALIKEQLRSRGRGAHQWELYNYPKIHRAIEEGFKSGKGVVEDIAPGVQIKMRPPTGFQSETAVRDKLREMGIDPTRMDREQVITSLATATRTFPGLVPYIRWGRIGASAAGLGGAGLAGEHLGEKYDEGRRSTFDKFRDKLSADKGFIDKARDTLTPVGDSASRALASLGHAVGVLPEESKLKPYASLGAGLSVAGLIYGLMRKKSLASNPYLRSLQEHIGDKPLQVATRPDVGRRVRSLLFGAKDISPLQVQPRGSAVLHHTVDPPRRLGEVNINAGSLPNAMTDKLNFGKIMEQADPTSIPRTHQLSELLKRFGGDWNKIDKYFKDLGGGYVVKGRDSALTSIEDLITNKKVLASPGLRDKLTREAPGHVIQQKIPITQEYRVHMLNNEPLTAAHRWIPNPTLRKVWNKYMGGGGGSLIPAVRDRKALMDFTRQATKKLEVPGENFHHALDVAKLPDGSFKLIESNPVPGTLMNPVVASKVHRAATGKWSRPVAATTATGLGITSLLGTEMAGVGE